jgi:YVTN family beta-propeller protein
MILRAAVLLFALVAGAGVAAAATTATPTGQSPGWPCSDPPPRLPDASWLWSGAAWHADWRNDAAVNDLASAIAQRAVPQAQATTRISAFAARQGDRRAAMAALGSGLIDTIGAELRLVIDGIQRFNTRQAQLAQRIEAGYGQADSQGQAGAEARDQVRWDTEIFEDRQRLLPTMCRIPGALTQRLGVLLAAARNAAGVQASDAGYLVYVTNETAGEVSVIDPAQQVQIGRIAIGKRPRGLVVSPDRTTLYVAVSGSPIGGPGIAESSLPPPDKAADGIAVVDLASRRIVRTLRGVSDPEQIDISPDGKRLYVSSEDAGELLTLDTEGKVLSRLAVGSQPEGVTVSPDGRTLLATSEEDNKVTVVDLAGGPRVAGSVPTGARPRNSAFLPGGRALVGGEFGSSLTLIDLARPRALRTIALGSEDRPMNLRHGTGAIVYVTTGRGGKLLKIDAGDAAAPAPILASASVGERPWGLALSPDGTMAYTANGPGEDVTAVDLRTMRVMGKIASAGGPWGIAVVPTR